MCGSRHLHGSILCQSGEAAPFLSFYPCFQSIPNSIALPPLCLCSIKMYQAGWRITGRGGLFILSPPAHINDLAPVVPRRGDVHINSSHTRERRGTRVEHRWVAGKRGETEGMGRGGGVPLPFILTVLFIISQTQPPPNLPRGCIEKEKKKKKLYHFVEVKTMNELTTVNMSPCRSDTFPRLSQSGTYTSPVIVMSTFVDSEIYNFSQLPMKSDRCNFDNECNFDSWL